MWTDVPPFVVFFAGALLIPFVRGVPRKILLLAIPLIGAWNMSRLTAGFEIQVELLGYTLTPVRVDELSLLFGTLFHLAAFIGLLYALHLRKEDYDTTQHVSAVIYAGSALGAVFAGDFLTFFAFWELLAVSSVFLIWTRNTEASFNAGLRYLMVHVVSGVILLAGAIMYAHATGSITFGDVGLGVAGGAVILLALGIKAAFPILHNWLPDAYPEGTATGTVFLSAFTTKVAVYALARGFAGTEMLIYLGAFMTVFPIFYAVIENDLRRVLSYSMMNQIGFMVVGVGIGSELALNGAVSHAFNDVLFKGLLFMSMGAVLHMTGRTKASELGGLYKTMPVTTVLCIVGAASISAFPLFNGFVSKSMIMSALLEEHYNWVWPVLLFASAGVVEHAGIKIPFYGFFAHDSGLRVKDPPINMILAMTISAVLCIAIGTFPSILYDRLPWPVDYTPYDATHVLTQLQLLFFAIGAVVALKLWKLYPAEVPSINLDFDWFYRRLGPKVVRGAGGVIASVDRAFRSAGISVVRAVMGTAVRHHGPQGPLARSLPAGLMVFWVALMLVAMLLFSYFGPGR